MKKYKKIYDDSQRIFLCGNRLVVFNTEKLLSMTLQVESKIEIWRDVTTNETFEIQADN